MQLKLVVSITLKAKSKYTPDKRYRELKGIKNYDFKECLQFFNICDTALYFEIKMVVIGTLWIEFSVTINAFIIAM